MDKEKKHFCYNASQKRGCIDIEGRVCSNLRPIYLPELAEDVYFGCICQLDENGSFLPSKAYRDEAFLKLVERKYGKRAAWGARKFLGMER